MNTPQSHADSPTRVYTPEPLHMTPGQALSPAQGLTQPLVVMQAPQPERSWVSRHKGDVAAASAAGILVILLAMSLAIVAVAVGIGAISCALGWLVIRSLITPAKK